MVLFGIHETYTKRKIWQDGRRQRVRIGVLDFERELAEDGVDEVAMDSRELVFIRG
jgi:hypothetical protein